MLVFVKLYNSWTVGDLSIKNERANSAYMKEPKTYNTIDVDFRISTDQTDKKEDNLTANDILISVTNDTINL